MWTECCGKSPGLRRGNTSRYGIICHASAPGDCTMWTRANITAWISVVMVVGVVYCFPELFEYAFLPDQCRKCDHMQAPPHCHTLQWPKETVNINDWACQRTSLDTRTFTRWCSMSCHNVVVASTSVEQTSGPLATIWPRHPIQTKFQFDSTSFRSALCQKFKAALASTPSVWHTLWARNFVLCKHLLKTGWAMIWDQLSFGRQESPFEFRMHPYNWNLCFLCDTVFVSMQNTW